MSAPAVERFLARLYSDEGLLRAFLADPDATFPGAGLSPEEEAALRAIDRAGLKLAAASYAAKRAARRPVGLYRRWLRRLVPAGV